MKSILKECHINSLIILVLLLGIKEILYSFSSLKSSNANIPFDYLYIERIISFLLGICFIFVAKGLFKRLTSAWLMSISIVSLILVINLFEKLYFNLSTILLIYILMYLLIQHKSFKTKSNPLNLKQGIILSGILIFCNLIFETVTLYNQRNNFTDILSIEDSLFISVKLLLYMDKSFLKYDSTISAVNLTDAMVLLNIIGLFTIIILVLRPMLFKPITSYYDKLKVQDLLMKYGTNPVSSIILENDKQYFFAQNGEGVMGYTIVDNVAIVAGEPICCDSIILNFLLDFKNFCSNNSLSICFCQVSSKYRDAFEETGFILQEYGKEAIISLDNFSINGTKAAKIRWANNKMNKLGIKVTEYKPLLSRDKNIEKQIHSVSNDWLKMKKSSELSFMLGSISLDNPFDKRYFIATNSEGIILGFIVCFPYKSKKGYFVDITRRSQNAPLGIMEKLIIDTCKILKNDDVEEVSLGLAPLADIGYDKNIQSKLLYKTFKFIYENMNSFYGFKSLYEYKKKYNPSVWEPRFIAFSSKVFTPALGYAMLKARNPKGIQDVLFYRSKALSKNI